MTARAYLRCSGWRNTRQAPKSPPSITRRSSALFSIQAKDICAAGWRSPSTSRSASLTAWPPAGSLRLSLSWTSATTEARGQVEERQALPLDGVLRQRDQRVLVGRGQGAGGEGLVDAEYINQGLAVKAQADAATACVAPTAGGVATAAGAAAATGRWRFRDGGDLGDAVDRVDGQPGLLGHRDRFVMRPDAVEHVHRLALARHPEQDGPEGLVDPPGAYLVVRAVRDRLDVQPGAGVVLAELLQEGVSLLLERRLQLAGRLRHDDGGHQAASLSAAKTASGSSGNTRQPAISRTCRSSASRSRQTAIFESGQAKSIGMPSSASYPTTGTGTGCPASRCA